MEKINLSKIDNYKNDNLKFFEKHAYIFKYDGLIRRLILDYKFGDKAYLYKTFSQLIILNKRLCKYISKYEIIIPVPINKKRFYERGYNQSELIAKELSRIFKNIIFKNNILIKVKNNQVQSTLNKNDRILNVKKAYEVKNETIIKDKKILLLDDIYTTGNTVNECARVLKENGAKEIGIITIAKD